MKLPSADSLSLHPESSQTRNRSWAFCACGPCGWLGPTDFNHHLLFSSVSLRRKLESVASARARTKTLISSCQLKQLGYRHVRRHATWWAKCLPLYFFFLWYKNVEVKKKMNIMVNIIRWNFNFNICPKYLSTIFLEQKKNKNFSEKKNMTVVYVIHNTGAEEMLPLGVFKL